MSKPTVKAYRVQYTSDSSFGTTLCICQSIDRAIAMVRESHKNAYDNFQVTSVSEMPEGVLVDDGYVS